MDSRGTERDTGQGRADASLDAILQCVALPVWVVDHAGVVVLANPAAVAALGYDDASELRGRHGHDTVHYKQTGCAAGCPRRSRRASISSSPRR